MERSFLLSEGALKIPCVICQPDHMPANQVILGVHGFGGSKNDPIQTSIAEEMGLYGSAMVRFDFPAHGESPVSDRAFTLENCENSLLAVAAMAKKEFFGIEDFCIFATGFGAFVTTLVLEELQEILGSIKLVLQTPDFHMADTLLAMQNVTEEYFRSKGRMTYGSDAWKIEIPYSFYEELRAQIVYNSFSVPMLLIHGELDDLVKLEDVQQFRSMNDQAKLVIIPGAGHRFLNEGGWDMVLDLVRDWFGFEQVLLCDWS